MVMIYCKISSNFIHMALDLGEAEQRFSLFFEIERYAGETKSSGFPRGWAVYLMKRKVN